MTMGYKFIFGSLGFRFPMTTVFLMMLYEWIFAVLVRRCLKRRPPDLKVDLDDAQSAPLLLFPISPSPLSPSVSSVPPIPLSDAACELGVEAEPEASDLLAEQEPMIAGSSGPSPTQSPGSEGWGILSWPPRVLAALAGVCFAMEVACANLSLLTLSVSFHTMVLHFEGVVSTTYAPLLLWFAHVVV